MKVFENISLKPFNTFGLDVKAKKMIEVFTENDIKKVLMGYAPQNLFLLGGGSNMLLTKDVEKTVVKISLTGKEILTTKENTVLVSACAGENWHNFVQWTIKNNFGGLENMSLIPGNVGTAPIQNIGAYGVELKDSFKYCEAIDVETLETITFTKEQCKFGYRDSIFKSSQKGKYIITKVFFELTTKQHILHINYGAIQNQLKADAVENATIQDISKAVIKIRESKLPNPKEIGNSGSFFKNPVLTNKAFNKLKKQFPDVAAYPNGERHTKVAAGWLIENAGWKGFRDGNFGVHKNQALVLVNYGGAKGNDIKKLSSKIQVSIQEKYGIELEAEVNIL